MNPQSQNLFKTKEDYFEFLFKWKEFEQYCIPDLTKLLLQKHPRMYQCDESFVIHIYKLCEHTTYEIFEHIWRIIIHNRQGKTPYNFPNLEFEEIKKYMKTYAPPQPITQEKYLNENFFIRMNEKDKHEFIAEINNDRHRGWQYVEKYTKQFIQIIQDILLDIIPELINIDRDWWLLYEYRFRLQFFHFSAQANRIEHTIECGLTGDWLNKNPAELTAKMKEIHLKEWHQKYGKNAA